MSCNYKRQVLRDEPTAGIIKLDGKYALGVWRGGDTGNQAILSSWHNHARLAWREVALRNKSQRIKKEYYA